MLISADDATRTMSARGFPELLRLYQAWGAGRNLSHMAYLQFPHNYNQVSRAAMYHWLNEHLALGQREPILEKPYQRLSRDELTVWNEEHPQPAADPDFQHKLLAWFNNDSQRQMATRFPRNRESLASYRDIVGAAWDILIRCLPDDPEIRFETKQTRTRSNYREVWDCCAIELSKIIAPSCP